MVIGLRSSFRREARSDNSLSRIEGSAAYAKQCLLARRFVERGVRHFGLSVVNTPGKTDGMSNPRGQHDKLEAGHGANALTVDRPVAALLKDLKAHGLLDGTLVLFSGELGRAPFEQRTTGRDHNPFGFSRWPTASRRGSITARPTNSATA